MATAACRWAPNPRGWLRRPSKCGAIFTGNRSSRPSKPVYALENWPRLKRLSSVRIVFLGGLGEIGRNCAWFEMNGRAVLVDCGLMFPDPEMLGVDLVLPDFTYIIENKDRLEGCVLTHGHEDHVGALAYLLREVSMPIYGSPVTLGLARNRIDEAGVADRTELVPVADGERREIGPFDIEFLPVTHSVPFGFALAFHTPQGVILHTGDFKLDLTPVDGRRTDLTRIGAMAAEEGIRLLLSDSTNAEEPGLLPVRASRRPGFGQPFRGQPGKTHHCGVLRQPYPPDPGGGRCGFGHRSLHRHVGAVHGPQRGFCP